MAIPKRILKIERSNIFETASRLMRKKGLSRKAALKEAWRDAKSPSGHFRKTQNRFKKK